MKKVKHFYNTADFTREEILSLVDVALKIKKGEKPKNLYGKTLGLLFFNPSLRTRVSFVIAMQKLGGLAIDIPIKDGAYTFEFDEGVVMDKGTIEHVKEAARVLSRYCDAIAIRSSELITTAKESVKVSAWEELKKDKIIKAFMKYAEVPVINMESNVYHPCQGLGDAVTIVEKLFPYTSGESWLHKFSLPPPRWSRGRNTPPRWPEDLLGGEEIKKKYVLTWVPHPKALPMATPNSQVLAACDLGLNVTVVYPSGWELDKEIVTNAQERTREAGGSLILKNDQEDALKDADFVCAKSWGAFKFYGNWEEEKKIREGVKHWIVDKEKMEITENGIFMHCLPVRRNVEVTDEVIDSHNSIVIDQAENRMWVQMAILLYLWQR